MGRRSTGFNRPFENLAGALRDAPAPEPPRPAPVAAPVDVPIEAPVETPVDDPVDEQALFAAAMDGARRLDSDRAPIPTPRVNARAIQRERENIETVHLLNELVDGELDFETADGDEHAEGAVTGLDARVRQRLRRGQIPVSMHLDLHGMTTEEAHRALVRFLEDGYRRGLRCVLVVHGRGRGSPGGTSVLKSNLGRWLARGPLGGLVLGFSTATQRDGGAGATYVLLRRRRGGKRPFETIP